MNLRQIDIKGFKSIDGETGQSIALGDITVLLGANGSGKSNVLSFFEMLQCLAKQELAEFVSRQGVSRLLFYGPKKTDTISCIAFFDDEVDSRYEVQLKRGLPDGLFISHEKIESGLVHEFLSGIRMYQFHDTSDTAKIKDRGYVDDAKYLRHDAGNLAAFLKMLRGHAPYEKYYKRIIRHIQRVMPQFGDFDLEPVPGAGEYVRLNWKDSFNSGYLFDPHQISDGSLRFMALATLLLQPPDLLPKLLILDEPELGLHPAAIAELGGLVKIAAQNTQVLLATQSTRLVDEFDVEDIVIVERDPVRHCSIFKKLQAEQLEDWLTRYSLSELWEKNVIGGQP